MLLELTFVLSTDDDSFVAKNKKKQNHYESHKILKKDRKIALEKLTAKNIN